MAPRPKISEYTAVSDEEAETFLNGNHKQVRWASPWIPSVASNAAGGVLIGACVLLLVLATIQCTVWYERRGSNGLHWRLEYSPLYDMMDVRQRTQYMESFDDPDSPDHIYRQPPSPEVDAAWERIASANGVFPMTPADVARAGKDPDLATDAPPPYGFPEGKTKMFGIEAFHQLHCLNSLRQGLIINYDYYWGRKYGFEPPLVFARHLNHCLDMLRQHLMCHPDLEPFTFNWRKGQRKPYADFEIRKTCVDFDALLEWSDRNKDPRHTELWRGLVKPDDALEKEAPSGIPQITDDIVWTKGGMALGNLTGLEGRKYCLGPTTEL